MYGKSCELISYEEGNPVELSTFNLKGSKVVGVFKYQKLFDFNEATGESDRFCDYLV